MSDEGNTADDAQRLRGDAPMDAVWKRDLYEKEIAPRRAKLMQFAQSALINISSLNDANCTQNALLI